jgi:hypothetical protein
MITVEKRTFSLLFIVEFFAGGKNLGSSRSGLPWPATADSFKNWLGRKNFDPAFGNNDFSMARKPRKSIIVSQRPLSPHHFAEYW